MNNWYTFVMETVEKKLISIKKGGKLHVTPTPKDNHY